MRAGTLATTIADAVPAPLAAAIAGPLPGIVADAIAILVNRVRPGALVPTDALPGALSSIVTHAVAICINVLACTLALTRPLTLLGKDGRRGSNQRDERKCQDECYAPCSCVHDTLSPYALYAPGLQPFQQAIYVCMVGV
jgi:hypothetical protein